MKEVVLRIIFKWEVRTMDDDELMKWKRRRKIIVGTLLHS